MAKRIATVAALGVAAALAVAASAAWAAAISGSISGPITKVSGTTFVVKTTLSPSGSSKVSVTSKTTIREQVAGSKSDLKTGECATAMGTKKGATITAARISLTPAVKGSCATGFRRPGGATRPPGGGNFPRNGNGFRPPANFAFAGGLISALKGSTVTIKGTTGTTKVTVGSKTQISMTKTLKPSALSTSLCAFVFGTSSDRGKTVSAQSVNLSKPRSGSCNSFFGRPR